MAWNLTGNVKGPQGTAGTTTWAGITDKPTTFAPSAHGHAQSDITGLTTALAAKADDSAVVKLTGNQTIAGGKIFTSRVSAAVGLEIHPAAAGASASLFLNNDNGQEWLFYANNAGNFGVWNNTDSRAPFDIAKAAPSSSLSLAAGGAVFGVPVSLSNQKIVAVADPTSAQDAATKAYVDAGNTNQVNGSNNGTATPLTLWKGTAAQYAAIATKDNNTIYTVTA